MSSGAPKENENPTIRFVDKERSRARRKPLEWAQLGNFQQMDQQGDWFPTTPEDRAVFHALVDTKAAKTKGVALLQNAGLKIPDSTQSTLKYPHFHVASASEPAPLEESEPVVSDCLDAEEVFDIIRNIQDPEHPHSLQELGVVLLEQIEVSDQGPSSGGAPSYSQCTVTVRFTPTIPHCSMATLIGLCLRVKLLRSLPQRFKVNVQIQPGSHASEKAINKQLRDKERVCAALENKHLAGVVNKCIRSGMQSAH